MERGRIRIASLGRPAAIVGGGGLLLLLVPGLLGRPDPPPVPGDVGLVAAANDRSAPATRRAGRAQRGRFEHRRARTGRNPEKSSGRRAARRLPAGDRDREPRPALRPSDGTRGEAIAAPDPPPIPAGEPPVAPAAPPLSPAPAPPPASPPDPGDGGPGSAGPVEFGFER